jgi:RimJ/RimL family protein N-acetyltransferase
MLDRWILKADGTPVEEPDLERWAHWMTDPHARRVAWTEVGEWTVSTVFLGIDHSFGSGPPVLWETMVFGPDPWDEAQWRYTTRAAALAEHEQIVEHVRRGGAPEDLGVGG